MIVVFFCLFVCCNCCVGLLLCWLVVLCCVGYDDRTMESDDYFNKLKETLEAAVDERSKSQAQWNLMHAVAHNPAFAKKVGVKQSVGKEFSAADAGHNPKSLPKRVVPKKKK